MSVKRCDLHVHSMYSRESGHFILRRLGAPESFTPPELIYELSKKRGMDFVTITDINTIEGVQLIAHHPDVFISEEVRTCLPDSRAVVHILVYDLTPEQHEEMIKFRDKFPRLIEFLRDQNLVHSLAHPFYFPGTELTTREFSYIINQVELVEIKNGTRARVENLAAEKLVRIARNDADFKGFTGGSDDHCGRFLGLTHTSVQDVDGYMEFLEKVREGEGRVGGEDGNAIRAAYSVYSIAYSFYRDRLTAKNIPTIATMAADRFFHPSADTTEPTLWHKADFLFHQLVRKAVRSSEEGGFESVVADELIEIGKDLNLQAGSPKLDEKDIDERTFEILNRITNRLLKHFSSVLVKRFSDGRILDALEALTALIPVVLLNTPYPLAYLYYKKGLDAVRSISNGLTGNDFSGRDAERRVWFTDTIDDLNGVSRTIQRYSRLALDQNRQLAVVACQSRPLSFPGWVVNFQPIREFPVPDYHSKLLSIPPFLEMVRFIDENNFGIIYISTPGPIGWAALGISKLLGIPSVGIYHTDYPRHVNHIIQDARMGEFAGSAAAWFYNSVDRVLVPSSYYMEDLESMGVSRSKMELFPRGTDCSVFSPQWMDEAFFLRFGGRRESLKLLYVGRVSREKDLDILVDSFLEIRKKRDDVELFIVGDGPYLGELTKLLSGYGGFICGTLFDEDLSRAYASADIFIFPSTTDTYGNSVLEAQASGLPAIVTDKGGPREIIMPDKTGLICQGRDVKNLVETIEVLMNNNIRRRKMGKAAREMALPRTWEEAFDTLWHVSSF